MLKLITSNIAWNRGRIMRREGRDTEAAKKSAPVNNHTKQLSVQLDNIANFLSANRTQRRSCLHTGKGALVTQDVVATIVKGAINLLFETDLTVIVDGGFHRAFGWPCDSPLLFGRPQT